MTLPIINIVLGSVALVGITILMAFDIKLYLQMRKGEKK